MKINTKMWLLGLVPLVLVFALSGCSKKPQAEVTIPTEQGPGDTTGTDGTTDTPGQTGDGDSGQTASLDLEDVFFDYDQHSLRPEMRRLLDQDAELLRSNTHWNLVLEGHCDERGTVEYNLALGEKRASAVKSYLARLGIDSSRLRTLSYGEERPFAFGQDESAWAQNRRVHFVRQ